MLPGELTPVQKGKLLVRSGDKCCIINTRKGDVAAAYIEIYYSYFINYKLTFISLVVIVIIFAKTIIV